MVQPRARVLPVCSEQPLATLELQFHLPLIMFVLCIQQLVELQRTWSAMNDLMDNIDDPLPGTFRRGSFPISVYRSGY